MVDELRALTERSREQRAAGRPEGTGVRTAPDWAQTSGTGARTGSCGGRLRTARSRCPLDDEEAVNLRDRAFRDGYGLLDLINRAGELAVRSITVLGSSTS